MIIQVFYVNLYLILLNVNYDKSICGRWMLLGNKENYTLDSTEWISVNFCRLLPEEECREGESVEEFAERVRKNIADSLSVPLTEFTWSDKQELVKRLEEEEKARRQEEQSEY